MAQIELTEENLLSIVLDSESRSQLFNNINAEQGTHLPLTNQYDEIGMRCQATQDQIRQVIHVLLEATTKDRLIDPFVCHSNAPDEICSNYSNWNAVLMRLDIEQGHKHY
jgi:hypothetical protein